MKVYLATKLKPKRGRLSHKVWADLVRKDLLVNNAVYAFVFHSKHVKIWTDGPLLRLANSKLLRVTDKTEHFDSKLLIYANLIAKQAHEKGYSHWRAADVITHYLFNMASEPYDGELVYHKQRVRKLKKAITKVRARQDHGWELDELKNAGML